MAMIPARRDLGPVGTAGVGPPKLLCLLLSREIYRGELII